MAQLDFVPLKIEQYQPLARKATAHHCGSALCEDGLRYHVKGINGSHDISATEWICSSMARSLSLPVPPMRVLQMRDGDLVFGSQTLPHVLSDPDAGMLIGLGSGNLYVPGLKETLSAIYAFDQVVRNVDRHDRNFLVQKIGLEGNQELANVYAIDFGSSELISSPEVMVRLDERTPTVKYGRQIRRTHGVSNEAASLLLKRFTSGKRHILETAMFGLPTDWYSRTARDSLFANLMSVKFDDYIESLTQGIDNGAFF
jgi:hypothetical protein